MSESLKPGPRAAAMLVLALTALAGALGGVALDRMLLRPDAAELSAERAPESAREAWAPRSMREPSWQPRDRYLTRLAEELGLSAEQRVRLDSLLAAQQERISGLMAERQPRMRAIVEETRSGMEEILNPEQREKLQELRHAEFRGPTRERRPRGPGSRSGTPR